MKSTDEIKVSLRRDESICRSDASFYDTFTKQRLYSSTPAHIQNMKDVQENLLSLANHASFKRESSDCLSCEKVLSCEAKCSKV